MFDNGIPTSEYSEIHLIFNHKNVWANLQNTDPVKIRYELHDDTQWLPYVRDDTYPHRWDLEADLIKFKQWQKFVEREKNGGEKEDEEEEEEGSEKLNIQFEKVDFRYKGEFMQAFQAFYGPKEKANPLTSTEIVSKETILMNEIEDAIK